MRGWQPIRTHPKKDSTWFIGLRSDGSEVRVHWAQDLSGSEQPAFSGFFRQAGDSFVEVNDLTHWKPEL
jgi:hypothetical protein